MTVLKKSVRYLRDYSNHQNKKKKFNKHGSRNAYYLRSVHPDQSSNPEISESDIRAHCEVNLLVRHCT